MRERQEESKARKGGAEGNRDQYIERERRGTDATERNKKVLDDMRGIRKTGRGS